MGNVTSGDALLALRVRVMAVYMDALMDSVTNPGAFGLGAATIQEELGCTFRVGCLLMDAWLVPAGTA